MRLVPEMAASMARLNLGLHPGLDIRVQWWQWKSKEDLAKFIAWVRDLRPDLEMGLVYRVVLGWTRIWVYRYHGPKSHLAWQCNGSAADICLMPPLEVRL